MSGQHWLTTGSPIPRCIDSPKKSRHAPTFNPSKGHDEFAPPGGLLPMPGTLGGLPDRQPGGLLLGCLAVGGDSHSPARMGMVVAVLIVNMKSTATTFPIFKQM